MKQVIPAVCLLGVMIIVSAIGFEPASARADDVRRVYCRVDTNNFGKAIRNGIISELANAGLLEDTSVRVRIRKLSAERKYKSIGQYMSGLCLANLDGGTCQGVTLGGDPNVEEIAERCSIPVEVTTIVVSRNKNQCGGNYCERRATSTVQLPGFYY